MVIESVQEFSGAEYAVDVFKLESPFPVRALTAGTITASEMATAFQSLNEAAGRPWVLLSAGAGADDFYDLLGHALDAGASGYLAGRAIWWDQAKDHSGDPAMLRQALGESAVPYIRRLNSLTDERALPWFEHPRFATLALDNAGPDFRRRYGADG
jgi:tagatose 1,6-diphosphate aldolase